MSQPESQYTSTKARTLQGLKDAATKSTAKATMDSLFQPLLEIPLQHIIITPPIQKFFLCTVEEYHLKVDQDEGAQTHTDSLKKAIKAIREKRDETTYDWTSLVGRDKKRLGL